MAQPARPLRADAARNRARVLEVAYETFAAEGLSVPIDEIARRAGVGAGTVYRHFPTKEDLFQAVVESRMQHIIDAGRALLDEPRARRSALHVPARRWSWTGAPPTRVWPTRWPGSASTSTSAAPDAEAAFLGLLGELLRAAQGAGTARHGHRGARDEVDHGGLPGHAGLRQGGPRG